MKKVVMFSHGHPKYSKGGAEIFAYDFFVSANTQFDMDCYLFCAGREIPFEGGVHCKNFSYGNKELTARQFVCNTPGCNYDYFYHRLFHSGAVYRAIIAQIKKIKPDVIHFQHYLGFGLPLILCLKNHFKNVPIFLTLHDYFLICAKDGKILNSDSNICSKNDPFLCENCYSLGGELKYAMRQQFIANIIQVVDRFISPSDYLVSRFLEWGLAEGKIMKINNGRNIPNNSIPNELEDAGKELTFKSKNSYKNSNKNRSKIVSFAFFGQLMSVKGIFLLLDALKRLPEGINAIFYINGSKYGLTPQEKEDFDRSIKNLKKIVIFRGSYEQEDLPLRMNNVDWVVCPSIWPENAPLVIQEAYFYKKPIICPSAGAFPEFVTNYKTGIFFNRNDSVDLSEKLQLCCENPKFCKQLSENIGHQETIKSCVQNHLLLYDNFYNFV
jgi:glycosyltransferase involved in cell wall biosynthesis